MVADHVEHLEGADGSGMAGDVVWPHRSGVFVGFVEVGVFKVGELVTVRILSLIGPLAAVFIPARYRARPPRRRPELSNHFGVRDSVGEKILPTGNDGQSCCFSDGAGGKMIGCLLPRKRKRLVLAAESKDQPVVWIVFFSSSMPPAAALPNSGIAACVLWGQTPGTDPVTERRLVLRDQLSV